MGEGQRPESPPWLGQDHFCLHGVYRDSEGSFVVSQLQGRESQRPAIWPPVDSCRTRDVLFSCLPFLFLLSRLGFFSLLI